MYKRSKIDTIYIGIKQKEKAIVTERQLSDLLSLQFLVLKLLISDKVILRNIESVEKLLVINLKSE